MLKHNNNIMLLLLLLFGFSISFAQVGDLDSGYEVQAKIKIVKEDNLLSVYPIALNNTDIFQDKLHYAVLSLKKSASGNLAKNVQSGYFSLKPDESIILSTQKLNIEPEEIIHIFLYIKRDSILISKDTLFVSNDLNAPQKKSIDESDMELNGLILDNVITKMGRDFYDKLNIIYRLNGVNLPMMIIIEEKPLLGGRTSEIKILVDENIVYQFNAQPDEEFLDFAAQNTYARLIQFHKEKQKLMKQERKF